VLAAPRRGLDPTVAGVFPLAAMALAFFLPVTCIY